MSTATSALSGLGQLPIVCRRSSGQQCQLLNSENAAVLKLQGKLGKDTARKYLATSKGRRFCGAARAEAQSESETPIISRRDFVKDPGPALTVAAETAEFAAAGESNAKLEGATSAQETSVKPPAIVYVAGATGRTGQRVVAALLRRGFVVRAAARDEEKARERLPVSPREGALEIVSGDVTNSPQTIASQLAGVDAVVCATGFKPSFDFSQPWKVDYQGTKNLVDACQLAGVRKLVLVSALLTNGAALGQWFNPSFLILNAFGLALEAKHRAEQYLWASNLDYTVLRCGGLKDEPASGQIKAGKEDTIFGGSISRDQVAEMAAEALLLPQASRKTVEIIAEPNAPERTFEQLYSSV